MQISHHEASQTVHGRVGQARFIMIVDVGGKEGPGTPGYREDPGGRRRPSRARASDGDVPARPSPVPR